MAFITINDLTGLGYAISKSIGTLSVPVVSKTGTGGTIPSGTYSVKVAAINLSAAEGALLNYQVDEITVDTQSGITLPTSSVTTAVVSGDNLSITIDPLLAAAAYAVFVGVAGAETLQIISTNYQITLSKLVVDGTAAADITEDSSGDTTALNNICQWASDLVDGNCRQPLAADDETEDCTVRIRNGMVKVFPRYLPLNSVADLTIYSPDLKTTLSITDFVLMAKAGYAVASATWDDGEYIGAVTYNHGFNPIPQDVKTATILIAQTLLDDFYFAKLTEIAGAENIKQGQLSISRKDTVKLPDNAVAILDKYRRVR